MKKLFILPLIGICALFAAQAQSTKAVTITFDPDDFGGRMTSIDLDAGTTTRLPEGEDKTIRFNNAFINNLYFPASKTFVSSEASTTFYPRQTISNFRIKTINAETGENTEDIATGYDTGIMFRDADDNVVNVFGRNGGSYSFSKVNLETGETNFVNNLSSITFLTSGIYIDQRNTILANVADSNSNNTGKLREFDATTGAVVTDLTDVLEQQDLRFANYNFPASYAYDQENDVLYVSSFSAALENTLNVVSYNLNTNETKLVYSEEFEEAQIFSDMNYDAGANRLVVVTKVGTSLRDTDLDSYVATIDIASGSYEILMELENAYRNQNITLLPSESTTTPTPTPPAPVDICEGVSEWVSGTRYQNGDQVTYRGNLFELRDNSWTFIGACGTTAAKNEAVQVPPINGLATVLVSPNPVNNGVLNIAISGANNRSSVYTISNILGQTVQSGTIEGTSKKLNLELLGAGIYLVNVAVDGKQNMIKILKN